MVKGFRYKLYSTATEADQLKKEEKVKFPLSCPTTQNVKNPQESWSCIPKHIHRYEGKRPTEGKPWPVARTDISWCASPCKGEWYPGKNIQFFFFFLTLLPHFSGLPHHLATHSGRGWVECCRRIWENLPHFRDLFLLWIFWRRWRGGALLREVDGCLRDGVWDRPRQRKTDAGVLLQERSSSLVKCCDFCEGFAN